MTEKVWIALIIVGGIVAVIWVFRDKLGKASFTASKNRVSGKIERHQNTGINISGNVQAGNENEISAETTNANIENNQQQGDKNRIRAATTNNKKK